jgi:hypothetical protein
MTLADRCRIGIVPNWPGNWLLTAWWIRSRRKPLLSWRVALLPYLEHGDLHKQFKLDEPWDSEHNKPLLEKMPPVFSCLGEAPKEKHATYYQVLVGKGTPFEPDQKIDLRTVAFADGTSNTVFLVEAAEAVPWTKPADLAFDPEKALPKLGGPFKDGFHACFGDCSLYFVKKNVPDRLLRQLIDMNDGSDDQVREHMKRIE